MFFRAVPVDVRREFRRRALAEIDAQYGAVAHDRARRALADGGTLDVVGVAVEADLAPVPRYAEQVAHEWVARIDVEG